MKLLKVNKFKPRLINAKGGYKFPTYETTGDNSFLFSLYGGIRNAGKSNAVLTLMENEREIVLSGDNVVYFVSPTIDNKVRHFSDKYKDNFFIYDELTQDIIQEILDTITAKVNKWKSDMRLIEIMEKYEKKKPLEPKEEEDLENNIHYLNTFDFDSMNYNHPPISTLIIDDSMSAPMISQGNSKVGRWFIKFALKHRHDPYYCNLFFLTQHIRQISKPLRVNCNFIVVFPFRDASIYKSIFDEYSTLFNNKLDNFLEVMKEIESRDNHSFLLIYYDNKRFIRINYNEEITLDN